MRNVLGQEPPPAGERDAAALTAGIDPNAAALVRRTLRLVADGPGMIFVAGSIQLAQSRQRADQLTAQALASGDPAQCADLAHQLIDAAAQAEQQRGTPWQALAAHLRVLAAQIKEA
ncbi:MAG: hypothetical protein EI684_08730 [Candidatus Viridilinea halotolerans]|uniref:Uncharacterized protein n=1 Tax=Candidatus Viridilinea halotolerans TaxID=2491704 RepID=A0A426U1U2_9CHLR|nr:MAG: hypothetical protein EI684_08730 [Candidatus Viridilinea halotolerans]